MPKCIELLPCDWLISNLCYQVEGCIGFGLPRDPTQILREVAVLPLLWAVRKCYGRPAGNGVIWHVIEIESTHEVEKKIKVAVYLTNAKQGSKSDIWKLFSIITEKNRKEFNLVSYHKCAKVLFTTDINLAPMP